MELTRAQKREQTMIEKYGEDWRKVMGQRAKERREAIHGKEQYAAAGRRGGASGKLENRPFYKNRDLARRAGKKGAAARKAKHAD